MTLSKETIGNVIEKLEHFSQNLKWTDVRGAQDLLAAADGLRELLERRERAAVELAVWYGSMPESNGKTNWTAIVHRKDECISKGITIDRSEYPDRVRYEADRVRYLIGELADKPWITSYDANKHSGYVAPRPEPVVPKNLPCPVLLEPGLRFGKGVPTQTMLDALQRRAEYYAELEAMTPEQRADHDAGMKEFAAMLQSFGNSEQLNSPVAPVGWVMVPAEPTEAMMLHKSGCQHHAWNDPDCAMRQTRRLVWANMLAAAPKQESE